MQLACDPLIAPARVLARQPDHQHTDLAADRRPPATIAVRPAPGDEPPMPPKQRRWRDEERSPARPRQQLTCGGKEDSIGRRQLRSTCLSAQYRELVSEHHDLKLLEILRAGTQRHELEHAAEHQVAERPEQEPTPRDQRDRRTTLRPTHVSQTQNRINAPHTRGIAPPTGGRRRDQDHRTPSVLLDAATRCATRASCGRRTPPLHLKLQQRPEQSHLESPSVVLPDFLVSGEYNHLA